MSQALDPVTQHHVRQAAERLKAEFAGRLLGRDDRALHRRVARPARRLADQRVRAGARAPLRARAAEGARAGREPDREGAARGAVRLRPQRRPQPDGRRARQAPLATGASTSARPAARRASEINPAVIEAMDELGVDMSEEFPKPLTDEVVRAADVVITMGCGDACPIYPGKKYEDWELDDPAGQDLDAVRRIRDEIDARVQTADRRAAPGRVTPRAACAPLVAEAIGTFALVFAGCGAIMVDAKTHALGHVGVAITFGLVIMVDDLRRRAHLRRALQRRGHVRVRADPPLPVAARRRLLGGAARRARSRPRRSCAARSGTSPTSARRCPSGSQAQSFLWELVMSAFLMFVILAVATDTRAVGEAAAIAIGGTIGLDAMFGGPISGASMNPMRSLGPALVSGDLHALWLYIARARRRHVGRRARLPVRPRRVSRRSARRRSPERARRRTRLERTALCRRAARSALGRVRPRRRARGDTQRRQTRPRAVRSRRRGSRTATVSCSPTSGAIRPTPTATAIAVSPVRHQAR